MKRRTVLGSAGGVALLAAGPPAVAAPKGPRLDVYKDPNCGCCGAWVEHMKSAGFDAQVHEVGDPSAVRRRLGMPDTFGGCHTATVAGYVIEGHVPAADVRRLLAARPTAIGLAVPGMPVGSPGMEVGQRVDAYDVLLVDRCGGSTVFARYPKSSRNFS